ncbi:MAG: SMI1/KNR4 family protein [Flavobacteriales bacterium]
MEIENEYNGQLPEDYLMFLRANPDGQEVIFNEYKDEDPDFEGRHWNVMGEAELLESWEMNGVGKAMNFECLKLYIKVQKEYSLGDSTTSNVGKIKLDRIESGFVIGDENGDYLYMDPTDNYSIYIYYHDGGDVLRISNSFKEFMIN